MSSSDNLVAAAVGQQCMKWVEIPPVYLAGQDLVPYPPSDFNGLFDWSERTDTKSIHAMPYVGQFLIDVVEIEDNAVHQPSKPANEIVCILNGVLELLTDGTEIPQRFGKGEMVLIPAGWAGTYRVISSDSGWFRELCIIPANYFNPATIPATSGLPPVSIERLPMGGERSYAVEPYSILIRRSNRGSEWTMDADVDEVVHVLEGTLTLTAGSEVSTFSAGAFVVVPKGFAGQAKTSTDYQELIARWVG